MTERETKPRRINTPSSAALAAVVAEYQSFNDKLENSLDATEHRYPTKQVVIDRIERATKNL